MTYEILQAFQHGPLVLLFPAELLLKVHVLAFCCFLSQINESCHVYYRV